MIAFIAEFAMGMRWIRFRHAPSLVEDKVQKIYQFLVGASSCEVQSVCLKNDVN
jgi:hypothetical protein